MGDSNKGKNMFEKLISGLVQVSTTAALRGIAEASPETLGQMSADTKRGAIWGVRFFKIERIPAQESTQFERLVSGLVQAAGCEVGSLGVDAVNRTLEGLSYLQSKMGGYRNDKRSQYADELTNEYHVPASIAHPMLELFEFALAHDAIAASSEGEKRHTRGSCLLSCAVTSGG